jgi:beta-lactamase regulating signal transducer with metallopeptidase domain
LSFESAYSLIPFKSLTIPPDIAAQPIPRIDSGLQFVNDAVNGVLPQPAVYTGASVNPFGVWTAIGSWAWLAGAAAMFAFGVAVYIRLKFKMGSAVRVEGNLYETDDIQSPFVLGILKPLIYIPLNLAEREREYIILHEQTHIRRFDHIVKFIAYFILCLHWFNPLVWIAFLFMSLDMEMSCDERVLSKIGVKFNKDYSMSLLSLAASCNIVSGSALAFGEDGVKRRIKNILKFRKSSQIAIVAAVAFVTALSLWLLASKADIVSVPESLLTETESLDMTADNRNNSGYIASDDVANTENVYTITDYYAENGKFSELGLALDEINSERTLVVNGGDILIAGGRRYEVTAESLPLSFYTQPSIDRVIGWWIDYLDSWAESGKVMTL